MSLLDRLKKAETQTTLNNKPQRTGTGFGKNTADEMLEKEIERLEKYIPEKNKERIITIKQALEAVETMGEQNDPEGILKSVPKKASKKSKKIAAKYLQKEWIKKNLTEKIKTKTGSITGKKIGKDTVLREVSYTRKDGKFVSYLQARSIRTGKILSLTKALRRKK